MTYTPTMQDNHVNDPTGLGLVPMVIEQSGRGERAYDIYSRLLKEGASSSWWDPSTMRPPT